LGPENEKPATTAPPSEIALSVSNISFRKLFLILTGLLPFQPDNRFIIVSNRDISFRDSTQYQSGPSDTLSTFSINNDSTLSLVQLAPSGGYSPRHFALNKEGDQIAVGHQNNRTVVIWDRDLESGKILGGTPAAVITLTGAVVCTIWDE
jgi:6-phosphogluconolactonase (cycloisomerase 2 family)